MLSGTTAIGEVAVCDAALLAIYEVNEAGGVLGKQLKPIVEDGSSEPATFAEKARTLISADKVATTFGGWTSASRKAMLPVFERNKALLYYPVQYEGLEQSPYVFCTGGRRSSRSSTAWSSLRKILDRPAGFLSGGERSSSRSPARS